LALEHLASSDHSAAVHAFLKANVTDATKRDAAPYCVSSARFDTFAAECRRVEKDSAAAAATAAAAAASRPAPAPVVGAEVPPPPMTRYSADGIAQNPTGWHDGKRVWGGGIVRLKK
jgi:hypothetical protein